MRHWNWRTVAPLLTAALLLGGTAHAVVKERGNIVSTDWNRMQMEIKSPQGRVKTWTVARDCVVEFTDKKDQFPNPKFSDLRAPMYIHFARQDGTDLIQHVEVVEVGFEPALGGPGTPQEAVVTNVDMNVGHVEVMIDPGGRKTFEVDPGSELAGVQKGDRVTLLIQRREGREVVTGITREAGGPGVQKAVVTSLDMGRGHVEVMLTPGGRKTFEVEPRSELAGVQQGDNVTLLVENRGGREVVTEITREEAGATRRLP